MGAFNAGNWGSFLGSVPGGVETEQAIQGRDYALQQARDETEAANRVEGQEQEQHNQNVASTNVARANNNANPNNQQQPYTSYAQQTGGVFDPARNAIHSALANIGQFYNKVFHGQQGQTNPQAIPSGRGPGPAAQQTLPGPGQTGAQAPAAMSRPQPGSSGPAAVGTPGATGPMPAPEVDQTGGRFAEGGAIPGRKLQGIRAKKAKPGNEAKATAGDKAVANAQPGAGGPPQAIAATPPPRNMPPRNTEPGAGISNQDPQLADGGEPKKNWIAGAVKKPGALHRDLGVPEGEKIPKEKIKAAEKGGGKTAKRAQLADTMSKFKDGGAAKFPKLEPGAAPEPKPAPNAVEQTVNNDGMRHYLGKTIKRYADGDTVKHEPNADVPTPAGMTPPGSPKLDLPSKDTGGWGGPVAPGPGAFAVGGAPNANVGNPIEPPAAPTPGSLAVGGAPNADVDEPPVPPRAASPGKGASPPQQNAAPGAPRAAEEQGPPAPHKGAPGVFDQQGPAGVEGYNRVASGGYDKNGQPIEQQGPPNPNAAPDAPVDFSQVKADQSQVPTMSTQDWDQMRQGISLMATAHGKSQGEANMMADEEVSGYQHKNFMQYLTQAQALDAAGNKQAAMTALKTAYQFFPTGHDMHFGLAPNGDILGYGVNEKTGEPVQNGLVHLNAQNLAGIISHFGDPKAFVDEGLRMQKQADETATAKAGIGLTRAKTSYFQERNPTAEDVAHIRADAAGGRGKFADPRDDKFFQTEFKVLPQGGEALEVAGELMRRYEQQYGHPDDAARARIAGLVHAHYDPNVDPAGREAWLKQLGIDLNAAPAPAQSPVRNRDYDPRTAAVLYGRD